MYSLVKSLNASPYMFIYSHYLDMNKDMVNAILSGNPVQFNSPVATHQNWIKPTLIDKQGTTTSLKESNAGLVNAVSGQSLSKMEEGNYVLGLNLNEVILKYGAPCAEGGMLHFANLLQEAQTSKAVKAVVIFADSPGGELMGARVLFNAVKDTVASGTPVYTYVNNGGLYSAAYWGLAPSTKIYASGEADAFGSIGGLVTIPDYSKAMESSGLKVHRIYAPQSTGKNKAYRDLMDKGDTSSFESIIKEFVDEFINDVAHYRNISSEGAHWAKGYEYTYEEAFKQGLVDGIRTYKELITEVFAGIPTTKPAKEATSEEPELNLNLKSKSKPVMSKSKLGLMSFIAMASATLGYELNADKDGGIYLNEEEQEKLSAHLDTLTSEKDSFSADKTKLKGELTQAQADLNAATEAKTSLEQKVQEQSETIAQLEAVKIKNTQLKGDDSALQDEEAVESIDPVTAEAQQLFNRINA